MHGSFMKVKFASAILVIARNCLENIFVRDEIEHLLDDNEDMADLYLARKWIQNQQSDSLVGAAASGSITLATPRLPRVGSNRSASMVTGGVLDDDDVEGLEMLLVLGY
ncbi:hypothetical protein POTOM_057786 [Populus tomentosa]|uniref:Uncharacterized protein n=1 Tax=Populus tomentosa TaxID=118781 RepID=A0A8X7Y1G6_POPTO|nr:hypothetical protein POTOM_057786 [Populus tomentosa]